VQRDKFQLLGGQQWLQMMIDAAPRQPKFYTGEDRIMSVLMRMPGDTNSLVGHSAMPVVESDGASAAYAGLTEWGLSGQK